MTGAERSWASHYEINDVVRYSRGSKTVGIEAGTYGTVVGIDPAANLLTVEKSSGEQATYDPRRLTGVSVYREIDREFSVGTASSSPRLTSRSASPIATLPSSSPSRQMAAFQPVWTITAQSNSTPKSIATSTTATLSPATVPRASPPSESW